MTHSRAQIIATLGPASEKRNVLEAMITHQLDVVRLNFSWGTLEERAGQIQRIRELATEHDRRIPIIIDLPGPRVHDKDGHTYDHEITSSITDRDEAFIRFAALHDVEYVAVSFVAGPKDIEACRNSIARCSGHQKIIAKIERAVAIEPLDEIIAIADAIMIARGDLGNEVPLEQIPFVQETIIQKANRAGKPVIVATQMLLSMVEHPTPTRAEVTDVTNAILQGSDAVMLSEETAKGNYPVEAVAMMEKIVLEAEKHLPRSHPLHPL